MNVKQLYELLSKKILFLDGATGTELQKNGLPNGVCPEKWVMDNPDVLVKIQRRYFESGSDAVLACTFGANRIKLAEFGFENDVFEFNKKLVEISREAAGSNGLVGADLTSTGLFVEPFGELAFEKAVEIYKEQIRGVVAGGADFLMMETVFDIQEARACCIAAKESCDLPFIASMTFSADGYTLNGTDPVTALITLQSLGADVFGLNCSVGPDIMLSVIKELKKYAKIPLCAKPNAGLPKLVDGKTVFTMESVEFASFALPFAEAGVNLFGGCCGTSYEYIRLSKKAISSFTPAAPGVKGLSALTSSRRTVLPGNGRALTIIGERINPTGKKKLQEELKSGKFTEVKKFAMEQEAAGALVLDVNVGMPGIDEKATMLEAIKILSTTSSLPLCIDSTKIDVIEAALRLYPGRALINSISAEKHKIEKLIPLAAKYGAMFIALPLTDNCIPKTCSERIAIVNEIFEAAQKAGFTKEDMVVDGLTMTVSSDQAAAIETLQLLRHCSDVLHVNTTLGLSNVSFGLPNRKVVNAAFLSMAITNGLTMAIANPCEEILLHAKLASDVLMGRDRNSKIYIDYFTQLDQKNKNAAEGPKTPVSLRTPLEEIYDAVIEGNRERIVDQIKHAFSSSSVKPSELVNDYLIPAINKVGELYEKKTYFLPQLIASAEAMKDAFSYIEPLLQESNSHNVNKKIILATVKGDIHDIGKNIVALMLKNYGYNIIDLGKDVACDSIITAAIQHKADCIGLSALMTTTMGEMKTVVDEIKKRSLSFKVIIGGAVVTADYAQEIGADGFARDGVDAVRLVKELIG